MIQRFQDAIPLAFSIAVLAFIWVEVSLNFSFHWVTDGDLGIGLALPGSFHLIAPAAFITWALFFAAGADAAATVKVSLGTLVGSVAGLVLMLVGPAVADLPDFWGLALVIAILAFVAVVLMGAGDWWYVPAIFGAFASVVFWWMATGLDRWAEAGGGVGNSVEALADPATAGSGAFGGVLSTPAEWVFASTLASLACGVLLGKVSAVAAGLLTPASKTDEGAREHSA